MATKKTAKKKTKKRGDGYTQSKKVDAECGSMRFGGFAKGSKKK